MKMLQTETGASGSVDGSVHYLVDIYLDTILLCFCRRLRPVLERGCDANQITIQSQLTDFSSLYVGAGRSGTAQRDGPITSEEDACGRVCLRLPVAAELRPACSWKPRC